MKYIVIQFCSCVLLNLVTKLRQSLVVQYFVKHAANMRLDYDSVELRFFVLLYVSKFRFEP